MSETLLKKKCRDCNIVLISGENIRPSALKKKDYLCKKCRNKRQRKKYASNIEEYRSKDRKRMLKWRKNNPEKALALDIRKFGLSLQDYYSILRYQSHVCALCKRPPKKWSRLCVDHCHITNKIRGLLCDTCNRAIGILGEDRFREILKIITNP